MEVSYDLYDFVWMLWTSEAFWLEGFGCKHIFFAKKTPTLAWPLGPAVTPKKKVAFFTTHLYFYWGKKRTRPSITCSVSLEEFISPPSETKLPGYQISKVRGASPVGWRSISNVLASLISWSFLGPEFFWGCAGMEGWRGWFIYLALVFLGVEVGVYV